MLDEKFGLLETKITTLLDEVKRLRGANAGLRAELAASTQSTSEQIQALQAEKAQYEERIQGLERDLQENASKEQEVRERLRLIIERIDALEQADEIA
jgi:predicted  nucleic acid-binding Zn-ribbon protein